jgi:hypothetical protein
VNSRPEHDDVQVALTPWQQGDCALNVSGFVYRLDAQHPVTAEDSSDPDSSDVVEVDVPGFVVLSQTCDIQRAIAQRPYVEVSALIPCPAGLNIEEVRKGFRPQFAYVPGVADRGLVADLDQVMTVEKPLLASWVRLEGCRSDSELRAFASSITRKFARFAFPNDFVGALRKFTALVREKHNKPESDEGKALRALREIRVAATPSWNASTVNLYFFFIRSEEQHEPLSQPWAYWTKRWLDLVPPLGRYVSVDGVAIPLSKMRADEYLASDQLDFDHLSSSP